MAFRLTKITTRTGDDGSTGLGDGRRVPKHDLRIAVLGDLDELNSMLGVVRAAGLDAAATERLARVQNDLFDLGGEVSIPGHRIIADEHLVRLDAWIAEYNGVLPPLREFILPGGAPVAAQCHVARTVCRRAERSLVALGRAERVGVFAFQYLNRLSDLMFVLGRVLNRAGKRGDVLWRHERRKKA